MMPSPTQLLIVLAIVLLVFGTRKIKSLGGDVGGAIREFRKGVSEDTDDAVDKAADGEDDPATSPPETARRDD